LGGENPLKRGCVFQTDSITRLKPHRLKRLQMRLANGLFLHKPKSADGAHYFYLNRSGYGTKPGFIFGWAGEL
jgi:hypothetical protein